MGLRPWTIFKKTLYTPGSEGFRIPLTTSISLASRARLQAEENGPQSTFTGRLALLLPSSAALWLFLLAARWRYSEPEKVRGLEKRAGGAILLDFLGGRIAAHLGPFQVPNLAKARLHEEPLGVLCRPLLLDHERARALSRLEQLARWRCAVSLLTLPDEPSPLRALEPAFVGALELQSQFGIGSSEISASQREQAGRIFFDVVCAMPPESRGVPPRFLDALVQAAGEPWSSGAQGEEIRAAMLVRLLEAPENCLAVRTLPEVLLYLRQPGMKRKEDTVWPLKAYLLSGETPDLLRRAARQVNKECPETIDIPPRKAPRDTPSLQLKHDLRNIWTTGLITAGWAMFQAWPGILDVSAVFTMLQAAAVSVGAMAVVEGLWRAEEHVIQSPWYFEHPEQMLASSLGMCALHCTVWAWAFRYSTLLPFIFCRLVKDEFSDAYRAYED